MVQKSRRKVRKSCKKRARRDLISHLYQPNSHLQHAMLSASNWGRSIFSVSYERLVAIFDKLEKNISSKKIRKQKSELLATMSTHTHKLQTLSQTIIELRC